MDEPYQRVRVVPPRHQPKRHDRQLQLQKLKRGLVYPFIARPPPYAVAVGVVYRCVPFRHEGFALYDVRAVRGVMRLFARLKPLQQLFACFVVLRKQPFDHLQQPLRDQPQQPERPVNVRHHKHRRLGQNDLRKPLHPRGRLLVGKNVGQRRLLRRLLIGVYRRHKVLVAPVPKRQLAPLAQYFCEQGAPLKVRVLLPFVALRLLSAFVVGERGNPKRWGFARPLHLLNKLITVKKESHPTLVDIAVKADMSLLLQTRLNRQRFRKTVWFPSDFSQKSDGIAQI